MLRLASFRSQERDVTFPWKRQTFYIDRPANRHIRMTSSGVSLMRGDLMQSSQFDSLKNMVPTPIVTKDRRVLRREGV